MSMWRLASTKRRICSTILQLRTGMSCALVCIVLPWCFIFSSWWYVDLKHNEHKPWGHWSSLIKVGHDTSTTFRLERFGFTIPYMDPDIAGKRVSEHSTHLSWWHWPGHDESRLSIITSIIDSTVLSMVNAAIAGLADLSRKIWDVWVCREEPNGYGGPYARNLNAIFNNSTAAG